MGGLDPINCKGFRAEGSFREDKETSCGQQCQLLITKEVPARPSWGLALCVPDHDSHTAFWEFGSHLGSEAGDGSPGDSLQCVPKATVWPLYLPHIPLLTWGCFRPAES